MRWSDMLRGLVPDTIIPPGAHTYQADVETVHRIIEDEFYEIESFSSPSIFLAKATQYVIWFKFARRNSYKKNKTPWEIIHQRNPTISPQIATLPAFSLDHLWKIKLAKPTKRGYDLVPYPYSPRIHGEVLIRIENPPPYCSASATCELGKSRARSRRKAV